MSEAPLLLHPFTLPLNELCGDEDFNYVVFANDFGTELNREHGGAFRLSSYRTHLPAAIDFTRERKRKRKTFYTPLGGDTDDENEGDRWSVRLFKLIVHNYQENAPVLTLRETSTQRALQRLTLPPGHYRSVNHVWREAFDVNYWQERQREQTIGHLSLRKTVAPREIRLYLNNYANGVAYYLLFDHAKIDEAMRENNMYLNFAGQVSLHTLLVPLINKWHNVHYRLARRINRATTASTTFYDLDDEYTP